MEGRWSGGAGGTAAAGCRPEGGSAAVGPGGSGRCTSLLETLREILRACGYDLETNLEPYEPDKRQDAQLDKTLQRAPQERLQAMLRARQR